MKGRITRPRLFLIIALIVVQFGVQGLAQTVNLLGEGVVWHKMTLELLGPLTDETATPNPYRDYRMEVIFTHPGTGTVLEVPGFFAADGDAANTGATAGDRWHCHFRPGHPGTWNYQITFRQGTDVAIATNPDAGSALAPYDGISGVIAVSAINKAAAPDLRAEGRLQYVGQHHLQFQGSKRYYLKFGPDSPENFLAYHEFDNTPVDGNKGIRHTFSAHAAHYQEDGETWQGGKGKNILGALNYLASQGANSISMLLYNVNGDGDRVFPYTGKTEKFRFDCSKLDQWEIVFDHAERKGLHLHFKLSETENDQDHDNGDLGIERRLYYREMIARFGHHLALNWNIAEEISLTPAQRADALKYFKDHDPWQSNRVFHTAPVADKTNYYAHMLGDDALTGISLQTPDAVTTENVFNETRHWVQQSAANAVPWIVACDEQGPGNLGVNLSFADSRRFVVWGNIMAGGAGVEFYSGGSDLALDDYAHFEPLLNWASFAVNDFFQGQNIPFWEMSNDDSLVSNSTAHCLTDGSDTFVVYLKDGGTTSLDLSGAAGTFEVRWFDPRNGGGLLEGSVPTVEGGASRELGNAPNNGSADWAILVRRPLPGSAAGTRVLQWTEDGGMVVIEAEHAPLADGWIFRSANFLEDPSMAGSLGSGWIEWTGPFQGGNNKEESEVTGLITYQFEIKKAGDYTFRWRTKQHADVESFDAGNDSFVKFETGTPLPMQERDGTNVYTLTKFTKGFVQSPDVWSYNAAFEAVSHHFVNNPMVHYEPGIHQIKLAARSKGHAIDRFTLYHSDVPYSKSAFENTRESNRIDAITYSAATDFTLAPAVDGRTSFQANAGNTLLFINAANVEARDKFARADLIFSGDSGPYDVTIRTVTEIDGESVYRLLVNDRVVATYQNPRVGQAGDLQDHEHTWKNIPLFRGCTISVEANASTNGLIPEGDGTAWSRGRWKQVKLTKLDTGSGLIVVAGVDKSVLLPTDSVTLTGTVTDNSAVASIQWVQVSGPNTATLNGQETNILTASSLVAGTYVFRLTAIDDEMNEASDEAIVEVIPAYVDYVIDFSDPFVPGELNGQQSWSAGSNWIVDSSNGGSVSTEVNSNIAVLNSPITLVPGESFAFSIDFEFTGSYTLPTDFVYAFQTGLKANASTDSLVTGSHEPDVNLQLLKTDGNYRLLNNFGVIPGASNLGSAPDGGDLLRIDYELTLGNTAEETSFTVQLRNLTDGTSSGTGTISGYSKAGSFTGVYPEVYDALTSGGAYLFFQRINPAANGSGLLAVKVNSVTLRIKPDEPVLSGFAKFEEAYGLVLGKTGDDDGDGFSNLIEFAFGGNPVDPDNSGALPAVSYSRQDNATVVHLSYGRRSDPQNGLTYGLQVSNDLATWQSLDIALAEEPISESLDFLTGSFPSADDQVFIRVAVQSDP